LKFSYDSIETQIIEILPELEPAAEVYAELEGRPGEDSGAYVFFESMFGAYVEILLDMPSSIGRDRLLNRAFRLVDEMLRSSDNDVSDLAYIGQLESKSLWFYSRALPFLRPLARRVLDKWEPRWQEAFNLNAEVEPDREVIDLYCAREVILRELKSEGMDRYHIPGNTYPNRSQGFTSLEIAKHNEEAVVFLACFSSPYVVCPPKLVNCTEAVLLKLSQNLAEIDNQEPNQKSKAYVVFPRIPLGERVWNMDHGDIKHLRYEGKLWIADKFTQEGLSKSIIEVLNGTRDSLPQ
jgi:hypothetical protein